MSLNADAEDIARLTGACYQKWVQGDFLSDEEVLAGAEYTQNVIRDLRFFGPSFRHVRSELIGFSSAMRSAHQYRRTLAPNDRSET